MKHNPDRFKSLYERQLRLQDNAGMPTSEGLICPLCWTPTSIENVTREHIIPECVGGRTKDILTCKQCNNESGEKNESHIANYHRSQEGFLGIHPFRVKLEINNMRFSADMNWTDQEKNFNISGKASNRKFLDQLAIDAEAGNVGEFGVFYSLGFSVLRLKTSILRSGYLASFRSFGYEYLKLNSLQSIRAAIQDPDASKEAVDALAFHTKDRKQDDDFEIGFANLFGKNAFIVLLKNQINIRLLHGCALPTEDDQGFIDHMIMVRKRFDADREQKHVSSD